MKTKKTNFITRDFFELFKTEEELYHNEDEVSVKLLKLLKKSVELRIPDRKFALLLSGGLDSVILAKLLKDSGKDFTCYIAATSDDKDDVLHAKKIAMDLNLDLHSNIIDENNIESYLKNVVPLIEDSNVVKVGVGTTIHIACEQAKKDGCKVIFSGIGADELFAGYARYKNQENLENVNKDTYSDILKFYEKNAYRDDVITMNQNLELRVPFLDKEVVQYGLNIVSGLKIKEINGELVEKYILRKLAEILELPDYIVNRKKRLHNMVPE